MSSDTKLFPLGCVYMTAGVNAIAEQHPVFLHLVAALITSHCHGDWDDLPPSDAADNLLAVERGSRILSSFRMPPQFSSHSTFIWIITEADRESTTVLFPGEY